jgi:hypothetical protein
MKQFLAGALVFALVSFAGYLSFDFAPEPSRRIHTGGKPGEGVVLSNPSGEMVKARRNPDRLWGGPNSVYGNPNRQTEQLTMQLLGGPNSPLDNLTKQLAGTVLEKEIAASENDCRDRLRQLGIVITAGPCTDITEIVDHLAKGTYSFNKPVTANMGEQFPLRLILKTADSQEQDIARSFGGLPGTVQQREGSFAQSVEATLTGDDFEIEPAGPQARTATLSHPVEWEWKLKPTSAGTKIVTIEVAANIQVGSDKHRVQINTLHESIMIQVSMFQRLKAYIADANGFVLAATALATPVAALIGFVPKVRKFFKDELARLRRRPNRADRRARRT